MCVAKLAPKFSKHPFDKRTPHTERESPKSLFCWAGLDAPTYLPTHLVARPPGCPLAGPLTRSVARPRRGVHTGVVVASGPCASSLGCVGPYLSKRARYSIILNCLERIYRSFLTFGETSSSPLAPPSLAESKQSDLRSDLPRPAGKTSTAQDVDVSSILR